MCLFLFFVLFFVLLLFGDGIAELYWLNVQLFGCLLYGLKFSEVFFFFFFFLRVRIMHFCRLYVVFVFVFW